MNIVWLSAAGLCGATIVGAILGFLIKDLPHRWNDTILGFCAGIMLSACTVGLIEPAFEMTMDSGITLGWLWVSFGVVAGALFLNLLDIFTPHMHTITGLDPEEHKSNHRLNGVLLFVMAIAIHKLPEGMAAGVTMNQDASGSIDWAVTIGNPNPHNNHLPCNRSAGGYRGMDRLCAWQHLCRLAPNNAGICRRRNALRNVGRDDSRNPHPRLPEAGHLCPPCWICNSYPSRKAPIGR